MEGEPDAPGGEDGEDAMAPEGRERDGAGSERWGRRGTPRRSPVVLFTHISEAKSGPRKHIMTVIGGTQMINPNFSSSARAVFFVSIFAF